MKCLLNAHKDQLTFWDVKVQGEVYTPFEELVDEGRISMACYFNIGIDAEIGVSKNNICVNAY